MLKARISNNKLSVVRYYKANEFPCEAIIKLVQTGVTVTLNSVSNTDIVDLVNHKPTRLLDTELHLSEGC